MFRKLFVIIYICQHRKIESVVWIWKVKVLVWPWHREIQKFQMKKIRISPYLF